MQQTIQIDSLGGGFTPASNKKLIKHNALPILAFMLAILAGANAQCDARR